MADSSLFGRLQ